MRIQLISDIHVEQNKDPRSWPSIDNTVDLLIFAGDISNNPNKSHKYFEAVRQNTKAKILYVLGNHEYWGWDINTAEKKYRDKLSDIEDLTILQNEAIEIDNIIFAGSTFWTDLSNPINSVIAKQAMPDYKFITNGDLDLQPSETHELHLKSIEFLKSIDRQDKKLVYITHHAPSFWCSPQEYLSSPVNPCFCSSVEDLMDLSKNKTAPDYWIYGHIHNQNWKQIYDTTLLSFPWGYPQEPKPKGKAILEL
jgi:predicted phosphodiesterase